ncbi:MAG: hypothetical protein RBU23_08320 [Candidatus Auribacterota bacterium]|nr:hypothetical protein [Candidatus Auribacterota bacterium]
MCTIINKLHYAILTVLLTVFAVLLLYNSWLGDDAYITFRTVDNFLNGYGLRWNPAERVQVYTHPLWLFILIAVEFFVRNIFYTAHGVSFVISLSALAIFSFCCVPSYCAALIGLTALMMSNAFAEYCSSGLENPMSYLLSVLFFCIYFKDDKSGKSIFYLSLLASLAIVNRMDMLLLFAPAVVFCLFRDFSSKKLFFCFLGFIPFILWEGFALVYYGFPFPNTAYAKLGAGIPAGELFIKARQYYNHSFHKDPITLILIGCALSGSITFYQRKLVPLAIGIALYMLYIVKIGGCFMSGRFFSVPFFWAVVLLIHTVDKYLRKSLIFVLCVLCIVVLGFCSPTNTLFKGRSYGLSDHYKNLSMDEHGIEDEQLCYYQSTGLMVLKSDIAPPYPLIFSHRDLKQMGLALKAQAPTVAVRYAVGIVGYYAGPQVYIVDIYALVDPLLARLPMLEAEEWRIGHVIRVVPGGYLESLESGKNLIRDHVLWKYYNELALVTRGAIFDMQRLKTIVKLNCGKSEKFQKYLRKFKNPPNLEHEKIVD